VELDRASEDEPPVEENPVEPVTAAPVEPESHSNRGRLLRSAKQNDFHYPN